MKKEYRIEELYQKGGYKMIDFIYGGIKMPKGSVNEMSKESYHRWKLYLNWRWKKKHPSFVKMQNRYYLKKRQKEKPYIAVCQRCGKEFNAARPYYKVCPDCRNQPTQRQIKEKEAKKRLKQKIGDIQEAQVWYKMGLRQEVIAEHFGVTQKTISNWIHNKNKLKW